MDTHYFKGTTARLLQIVLDWFGKLLALPEAFLSTSGTGGGGCIQGAGATTRPVALSPIFGAFDLSQMVMTEIDCTSSTMLFARNRHRQ